MCKKYSYKSIISFLLIVSTVLTPLSFIPKKAQAQSVAGYTSGLIPAILTLPQCNLIGGTMSAISSLFSGGAGSDVLSSLGEGTTEIIYETAEEEYENMLNLEEAINSGVSEFDSVKVNISGTAEGRAILETNRNTKKIKASTESINENSTCIQSIGRLIVKMLLQKLTVSTISWINSGFDGQPAFLQDPGKFFNDIAKNEILQFGLEISNPDLFPFGQAWLRNTAAAFNNKFQDNARYSLDELIQSTTPEYSGLTFQQDFSQGGWNAWTAMTQAPQNNPLGFKLMADNEIQNRLAGTVQSTAEAVHEALSQADGFLGDYRCVDPVGVTQQQKRDALAAGKPDPCTGGWQYVTPGSLVATAATTAMGYQNNALLNVEDLNDAVAAILDALLAQFSSTIMEKGFANYGDTGADGRLVYDSSSASEPFRTRTQQDFMPSQLATSWLSSNPNFNIRTDFTQALIDEQRTYIDKLEKQNKELLSTTDGNPYKINDKGVSNTYGLIPVINQLDYCIPGPHPGWEDDSRRAMAAALSTVTPETQQSLEDFDLEQVLGMARTIIPLAGAAVGATVIAGWLGGMALGATLGSAVPVVGTIIGAVVGVLITFVIDIFASGDDGENVRAYYAEIIRGFTGQMPDYREQENLSLNLMSKSGAENTLNGILNRYIVIIKKIYHSDAKLLPLVSKEAAAIYNQLTGYGQMIQNNEEKTLSLRNVIEILIEIKDKVEELNNKLVAGTFIDEFGNIAEDQEAEYERSLKPQINAFGRLSANMINGADIAGADNILKQIIDKKNYIYKNLLKGPYGCEVFLEKEENIKKFPAPWSSYDVNSVKRMTYLFPVLYDYNVIAKGTDIPDPWGQGSEYCTTRPNDVLCKDKSEIKMPKENMYDSFGPGFLSFIVFTNDTPERQGEERLKIHDLFPTDQNVDNINNTSVPLGAPRGPFESFIGIY